jgi:hypothetical protein
MKKAKTYRCWLQKASEVKVYSQSFNEARLTISVHSSKFLRLQIHNGVVL